MTPVLPATTLVPTEPGTPFAGGFYVGRIRLHEHVCALIVAPKATGETTSAWHTGPNDVPGACSFFDGSLNTGAMAEAGAPLAHWARGLVIDGFDDWYLPSRDELELLYRHLKPTTEDNWRWRGDNPSSVPVGYPYALQVPAQTSAPAFQEGGEEAMEPEWYWSSTQYSAGRAWDQDFDGGNSDTDGKSLQGRARAVRRLIL